MLSTVKASSFGIYGILSSEQKFKATETTERTTVALILNDNDKIKIYDDDDDKIR